MILTNKSFILSLLILLSVFVIIIYNKDTMRPPTPTEYIEKKKNKKEFKKNRKDWIENMHKAAPDVDWRQIDKVNRKNNTDRIRILRESLLKENQITEISDNFEVIVSRNIEGTWIERGSNNLAGRIRTADIDFSENMIYCVSSGGNIWRGTIEGENWQSLNDYMQILGVTFLRIIDTDNGKRLLIGSENDGFYYSDNYGLSLSETNGLGNNYVKRFVMQSGTNHIYALVNDYPRSVYRSTDLGENFELFIVLDANQGIPSENISHFDIFTPRYSEDDIYLLNDMHLYKIVDNNLISISYLPALYNDDVVLTGGIGGANGETFLYAYVGGHIFRSIDEGENWIYKGESPSSWWWINGFNSSNIDRNRIFVGGMELFGSSNDGNDWSLVNPWWEYYNDIESKLHADIPEIRFYLDEEYNEVSLISTDGGLYWSDDYLESVQNISLTGLGVSQYYSTYSQRFYPYQIYAGSQDQGFQKSITSYNGVEDFEQIISGDYGHLVSGNNGIGIWANYPGFSIYYPDISNSNSSLSLDFPGTGHLWLAPIIEHPSNPNKAILGGGGINGGNHLIELSVFGNQIVYEQNPYNFTSTISAMGYSPIDSAYRYVLTENGKFYYSSDGGESWNQNLSFSGPGAHYFYGSTIWASSQDLGRVYIGGSGYSNSPVYVSYNHGQTFTELNNGLPNTLVFELAGTPNDDLIFAATEIGPYVYSEDLNEWFFLSGLSAPDQTYWSVDFIPEINTARFGTYGRGIWDFVIDGDYNINLGDVNFDNNVNIQDIILLVNFILELNIPTEVEFISSDMNSDGVINVLDIVLIVDIIFNN